MNGEGVGWKEEGKQERKKCVIVTFETHRCVRHRDRYAHDQIYL